MSLAGVWQNEYGSRMSLQVTAGQVHGSYASTTGSTGSYVLCGCTPGGEAVATAGVPVALAISWRSVVPGARDASWHWVSALSGQICQSDGQERLVLNHLLVASCEFPEFCGPGTYVDKLIYRRVEPPEAQSALPDSAVLDAALTGGWRGDGVALELRLGTDGGQIGRVSGRIALEGQSLELAGFADILPGQPALAQQAVSLTALDAAGRRTFALAGVLHLAERRLQLQLMTARGTPAADSYLQTAMRGLSLSPAAR